MAVLIVPARDEVLYPSLGKQVCDFIEAYLIHGPGDLRGQPARLDAEKRWLIYRMYELYPRGHAQAGRRRFKRAGISLRKGTAKTEFAAWIAACELHPDGPVRFGGWDASGQPVGVGVRDPYIPMLATAEEQAEDLAYGALHAIIAEGPLSDDFDIGLERIMRRDGAGKAVALASAPNSRDGALTTFQHFDETHRFILPRIKEAHETMLANIPKRFAADAWSLETTTAPAPGQGSIAEKTMDYARQVANGAVKDSRLFYFHRQASEDHDLSTPEGVRAAVVEASGPAAEWSDLDNIAAQWQDPTADQTYLRRVWLNQMVRASERAFDVERWKGLAAPREVPDGAKITLGFDGARVRDASALVATEIVTGYQWLVGLWERPPQVEEWEVPVAEVDEAVALAFARWDVWRLYADPPYWQTQVAQWAGTYGEDRVIFWWTNRVRPMVYAIQSFASALNAGELSHSGDARLERHIGNAVRRSTTLRDEDGKPLWMIQKERPDSPHKMDGAMATVLSWEARKDAIKSGVTGADEPSVYETRGVLRLGG